MTYHILAVISKRVETYAPNLNRRLDATGNKARHSINLCNTVTYSFHGRQTAVIEILIKLTSVC